MTLYVIDYMQLATRLWRRRHCRSHPPRIRQSLSNSAAVPWSLSAAPHRSRSIVWSAIFQPIQFLICPFPLRTIELLSWKIKYRSATMWAVCCIPAGIVDDFMTLPTTPINYCIELEFRSPFRRLGLILWGDAVVRCIFRQGS